VGKLFWKFFFGFWACLLVAALVTGGGLYVLRESTSEEGLSKGPDARFMMDTAQLVLEEGGPEALKRLLEKEGANTGGSGGVFALSSTGQDILGRAVSLSVLRQVREKEGADARGWMVRSVVAVDRSTWVLFVPRSKSGFWGFSPPPGPPPDGFGGPPPGLPPGPPPGAFLGGEGPPSPLWFTVPWLSLALFASVMFAAGLAYWFSRPLNKLKDAFREAAKGRLGLRIASSAERGEIAELLKGFDHMAGEIESKIQQQNTLLHDVSHELRSPLARLNLAVGLLRQSPGRLETSLDRIEREAERLDVLIGELLNLSRLEGQRDMSDCLSHNVVDLLSAVVEDADFEAGQLGRTVEFEAGVSVWEMRCEPDILQRAFDNIIRNAIRYTPESDAVRVACSLGLGTNQLRITIQDVGPGVPAEMLSCLFVPFFKHGELAGHGLGLAIAKRAIERHGGAVRAENVHPHGLRFCIDLMR
jgi:two-component system OmpR family sensor kinase